MSSYPTTFSGGSAPGIFNGLTFIVHLSGPQHRGFPPDKESFTEQLRRRILKKICSHGGTVIGVEDRFIEGATHVIGSHEQQVVVQEARRAQEEGGNVQVYGPQWVLACVDLQQVLTEDQPCWNLMAGPHYPGVPGFRGLTNHIRVSGVPPDRTDFRKLLLYWIECLGGRSAVETSAGDTSHVLTWNSGTMTPAQLEVHWKYPHVRHVHYAWLMAVRSAWEMVDDEPYLLAPPEDTVTGPDCVAEVQPGAQQPTEEEPGTATAATAMATTAAAEAPGDSSQEFEQQPLQQQPQQEQQPYEEEGPQQPSESQPQVRAPPANLQHPEDHLPGPEGGDHGSLALPLPSDSGAATCTTHIKQEPQALPSPGVAVGFGGGTPPPPARCHPAVKPEPGWGCAPAGPRLYGAMAPRCMLPQLPGPTHGMVPCESPGPGGRDAAGGEGGTAIAVAASAAVARLDEGRVAAEGEQVQVQEAAQERAWERVRGPHQNVGLQERSRHQGELQQQQPQVQQQQEEGRSAATAVFIKQENQDVGDVRPVSIKELPYSPLRGGTDAGNEGVFRPPLQPLDPGKLLGHQHCEAQEQQGGRLAAPHGGNPSPLEGPASEDGGDDHRREGSLKGAILGPRIGDRPDSPDPYGRRDGEGDSRFCPASLAHHAVLGHDSEAYPDAGPLVAGRTPERRLTVSPQQQQQQAAILGAGPASSHRTQGAFGAAEREGYGYAGTDGGGADGISGGGAAAAAHLSEAALQSRSEATEEACPQPQEQALATAGGDSGDGPSAMECAGEEVRAGMTGTVPSGHDGHEGGGGGGGSTGRSGGSCGHGSGGDSGLLHVVDSNTHPVGAGYAEVKQGPRPRSRELLDLPQVTLGAGRRSRLKLALPSGPAPLKARPDPSAAAVALAVAAAEAQAAARAAAVAAPQVTAKDSSGLDAGQAVEAVGRPRPLEGGPQNSSEPLDRRRRRRRLCTAHQQVAVTAAAASPAAPCGSGVAICNDARSAGEDGGRTRPNQDMSSGVDGGLGGASGDAVVARSPGSGGATGSAGGGQEAEGMEVEEQAEIGAEIGADEALQKRITPLCPLAEEDPTPSPPRCFLPPVHTAAASAGTRGVAAGSAGEEGMRSGFREGSPHQTEHGTSPGEDLLPSAGLGAEDGTVVVADHGRCSGKAGTGSAADGPIAKAPRRKRTATAQPDGADEAAGGCITSEQKAGSGADAGQTNEPLAARRRGRHGTTNSAGGGDAAPAPVPAGAEARGEGDPKSRRGEVSGGDQGTATEVEAGAGARAAGGGGARPWAAKRLRKEQGELVPAAAEAGPGPAQPATAAGPEEKQEPSGAPAPDEIMVGDVEMADPGIDDGGHCGGAGGAGKGGSSSGRRARATSARGVPKPRRQGSGRDSAPHLASGCSPAPAAGDGDGAVDDNAAAEDIVTSGMMTEDAAAAAAAAAGGAAPGRTTQKAVEDNGYSGNGSGGAVGGDGRAGGNQGLRSGAGGRSRSMGEEEGGQGPAPLQKPAGKARARKGSKARKAPQSSQPPTPQPQKDGRDDDARAAGLTGERAKGNAAAAAAGTAAAPRADPGPKPEGRSSRGSGCNRASMAVAERLTVVASQPVGSQRPHGRRGSGGGGGAKLVFALSGFTGEERTRYGAMLKALHLSYIPVNNDWDPRINALLAPSLKRSDKTVCAMAAGAWLLRADYLAACQGQREAGGGPVHPEEYELEECEDGAAVISAGAPAHWRRRVEARGPAGRAFSGLRLLVPPGLPPPLDSATLSRMVAAGGGVAVVKAGPSAAKGCHAGVVPAGCKQEDKLVSSLRVAGAAVVAPAYVVDWVAHPRANLAQHYSHCTQPGEALEALERDRGGEA